MIKYFTQISFILFLCLMSMNKVNAEISIFNIEQLNSIDDEYAPNVNRIENYLYFNSSNSNRLKLQKIKVNTEIFKDFDNDNLGSLFINPIIEVTDNIVKSRVNPTYLSFWGQEVYFTGKIKTKKGALLGIYKANYEKNNWQITRQLEELDRRRFNFHPTVSPSGNIIVFCSADEKNPYDTDLMIAYRDDKNTWSSAIPLNDLNTNLSEITPFFASDDTLYFASNGFDGRGGYDIFYTTFENGKWQKPRPVDGINTEFDESDFVQLANNLFLFSSNRPGGMGGLDIWAYFKSESKQVSEEPTLKVSLNSNTFKIVKQSYSIQVVNNSNVNIDLFKSRYIKNKDYYDLYYDSLISSPSHLEINYKVHQTKINQNIELKIYLSDEEIYQSSVKALDTLSLIPLNSIINPNNIPEELTIKSTLQDSNLEKQFFHNKIEIYKSQRQSVEVFEIDNVKYRLIVVPFPDEINKVTLENSLAFLKKEVKYKNGKIIVESSPTFELYDTEKIKTFLNTLNINNNVIIYQKKVVKNLAKYFNNLNFNYLIIYLQI